MRNGLTFRQVFRENHFNNKYINLYSLIYILRVGSNYYDNTAWHLKFIF